MHTEKKRAYTVSELDHGGIILDSLKIPDQNAMKQAMKFAESEAGQRFLASLQQSDKKNQFDALRPDDIQDETKLRQSIHSLMESPQFRQLMKHLGENNG